MFSTMSFFILTTNNNREYFKLAIQFLLTILSDRTIFFMHRRGALGGSNAQENSMGSAKTTTIQYIPEAATPP